MCRISKLDVAIITNHTHKILQNVFTENSYRNEVVLSIIEEVIQDIEETADESFNDSDISLAVQRTIMKKIGCEV